MATSLNLTLQYAGRISGRVTRAVGGLPIPGASVWCSQSDGLQTGMGTAEADAAGYYTISGLDAPGTYNVAADAQTQDADFSVKEITGVGVSPGQDTPNINFALEYAGKITGRITTPAPPGTGIANAQVWAWQTSPWSYGQGTAVTDSGGYYTISGLDAPGYYLVAADHDEFSYNQQSDVWVEPEPGPG